MPKTQVLVPTTNPKTGEPLAAGASVDLDDEAYNYLRQAGAVAASEEETKAGQIEGNRAGVYDARTTRENTGRTEGAPTPPKEAPKAASKPAPEKTS